MNEADEQGLFAMTANEGRTLESALNAYGGKLRPGEVDPAWELIVRLRAWIARQREGPVSLHGD